jgi:hypothetical protein
MFRTCVGISTRIARGANSNLAVGCLQVMDLFHGELQWCLGGRPDDGSMPEASLKVVFANGRPFLAV